MENLEFEKQYKEKGLSAQRRYPNEALIQFLASHYFYLSPATRKKIRVLEIGCGSGANLWMVAKEGFSSFGIDIAPTGIKYCKEALKKWGVKSRLSVGNMKKLNFNDGYFDIIFDIVSMQHVDISGHMESLKETFRCLKKGGRFFQWHLGTNSTSFADGGGKHIDRFTLDNIKNPNVPLAGNGLTCFLTPALAEKMLRSVGFKNIEIEIYSRTYKKRRQKIEYSAIQAQKI